MLLLVGAGVGRQGDVEKVFLEGWKRGRRNRFAAGWGCDYGQQNELGDGGAWYVDALGVGAGVGRSEKDSGIVEHIVEDGNVYRSKALELVGLIGGGAEGQAKPKPFGSGTGQEGAADETFGIGGVAEVEVANVADVLDIIERKGDDVTGEIEEVDCASRGWVPNKTGGGQVAGKSVSDEAAHDYLFAGGGHWGWADCRMQQ